MNDVYLSNISEDQIINDLAFSYEFYSSGGDIRDQDKLMRDMFVLELYNNSNKQDECEN